MNANIFRVGGEKKAKWTPSSKRTLAKTPVVVIPASVGNTKPCNPLQNNHLLLQRWLSLACVRAIAGVFVWARHFLVHHSSLFYSCLSWTTVMWTWIMALAVSPDEEASWWASAFLSLHNFTDMWFIVVIDLISNFSYEILKEKQTCTSFSMKRHTMNIISMVCT